MKNNLVLKRELAVLREAFGPIVLEALADKYVVEVMVNADGKIWVDRIGKGREFTGSSLDYARRDTILKMVAHHTGEMITRENPQLSATLPETGERFQGLCPPIVSAPSFTIRKRPQVVFTLDDYIEQGSLTLDAAQVLRRSVEGRKNILIAGGKDRERPHL